MNETPTQDQFLRDFLRLLRRHKLLILGAVLVAGAFGVAYSVIKNPVYEASAQLQFNDQSAQLNLLGVPTAPAPANQTQPVAAASQVLTSPAVARRVAGAVPGRMAPSDVVKSVSASVDPATNLVVVTASAGSARLAADLANSVVVQGKLIAARTERATIRAAIRRLRRTTPGRQPTQARAVNSQRRAQLQSLASVATPFEVASRAQAPSAPSSPKPARDIALALVLGVIAGLIAAFIRDSLDKRLTDAREVEHELRYPIAGYIESEALGRVPFASNGSAGHQDAAAEAFRILRSNVDFLAGDRPPKTIAVTSPLAQEGKSTVAAGLAIASALVGKRVLLVESDLRRPVLAERLGLAQQPGLTDWLTETAAATGIVQLPQLDNQNGAPAHPASGLPPAAHCPATVVAGTWSAQPTELLGSPRFRQFLNEVAEVYDLIVLDCPPLLPVGDTREVLPLVEAVLVCVRLDQTTREQGLAAKAALAHFPARPTGLVITGVRPGREGYYYGYYSPREVTGDPRVPARL